MIAETQTRRKLHSNRHKRQRSVARLLGMASGFPPLQYQAFKRQKRIEVPKRDELGAVVSDKRGRPVMVPIVVDRWRIQVAPNCVRGILLSIKNPNRGRKMGKRASQVQA